MTLFRSEKRGTRFWVKTGFESQPNYGGQSFPVGRPPAGLGGQDVVDVGGPNAIPTAFVQKLATSFQSLLGDTTYEHFWQLERGSQTAIIEKHLRTLTNGLENRGIPSEDLEAFKTAIGQAYGSTVEHLHAIDRAVRQPCCRDWQHPRSTVYCPPRNE